MTGDPEVIGGDSQARVCRRTIQWVPSRLRGCNFPVSGTLPDTGSAKMVSFPTIYQRVVVHWRAIILLVILTRVAFLVASSDEFVSFELNLFALLLIFIASQV